MTTDIYSLVQAYIRGKAEDSAACLDYGIPWMTEHLTTQPGDMVVLAAEYGAGKSMLAMQMASYMASHGQTVTYYNLDNVTAENVTRLLASMTRINSHRLVTWDLAVEELEQVAAATEELRDMQLRIVDATGWTAGMIDQDLADHPSTIAIVDHMQNVAIPKVMDQTAIVNAASKSLSATARRRGCVLIALSQIVTPPAYTPWQKPTATSLRDSKRLIGDARAVVLMYAPHGDNSSSTRVLELVKSNNDAPGARTTLLMDAPHAHFSELEALASRKPSLPKAKRPEPVQELPEEALQF